MVPRTPHPAVVDSVDAAAIDEALARVRKQDTSLTVTVPHDGDATLHVRLYVPGKRRPSLDLFVSVLTAIDADDFDVEETTEVLAAVEAVLPQLQTLRDRLAHRFYDR